MAAQDLKKAVLPPPIPRRAKREAPKLVKLAEVDHAKSPPPIPSKGDSLSGFGFLVGTVCGYAVAYMILLEPIELLGHRMFWTAISEGRSLNVETVLNSSTFFKLAGSSAAGSNIGSILARRKSG